MLELRQTIVQALAASFRIGTPSFTMQAISPISISQRTSTVGSRQASAPGRGNFTRQSREELNILMGLWGAQTEWQSAGRLPDIPEQSLETKDIERLALERSLDLAQIRQRVIGAGEELGLTRWTTLLPDFSAGPKGERNDGAWEVGPQLRICDSVVRSRSGSSAGEQPRSCGVFSRSITLWACEFERKPAGYAID